jgi:hypothetical protein
MPNQCRVDEPFWNIIALSCLQHLCEIIMQPPVKGAMTILNGQKSDLVSIKGVTLPVFAGIFAEQV